MPLNFLCGASISFSGGLICLAFSLFPHTGIPVATSTLIGVLAASCLFVLGWRAAMSPPYRSELWNWTKMTGPVPEIFPDRPGKEFWALPNEPFFVRPPPG